MSKIKKIRVKQNDTSSAFVDIGANAINIDLADGSNAEDAIMARVTQDLTGAGAGTANPINADTLQGKTLNQIITEYDNGINRNSLEFHRNIYRGINLISAGHFGSIAALNNSVKNGDWSDIYIGDYFDITYHRATVSEDKLTISASATTAIARLVVMDIDYFLYNGDSSLTRHHLVLVPKNILDFLVMNTTDTSAGAYYNSLMHQTYLPYYANEFETAMGGNFLITYRDLFSDGMDANASSSGLSSWKGVSNSWNWYDTKIRLLTEPAVYGTTSFSSSGFDVGVWKTQLAGFRLNPALMKKGEPGTYDAGRHWWWLSSVARTYGFCRVGGYGDATADEASSAIGVAPLTLFG